MTIIARSFVYLPALLFTSVLLSACSAPQLGVSNGKFQACPAAPHCVSSTENGSDKYIAPISVKSQDDWLRLQNVLLAMPRTELISRDTHYLHAVTSTAIMRYKDDVELLYTPSKNTVDVRSSSRIGYYDFEVNRERIETLRSEFQRSK